MAQRVTRRGGKRLYEKHTEGYPLNESGKVSW